MALLVPIAWVTSRRFPIGPPHWVRNTLLHIIMTLVVAAAWVWALMGVFALLTGTPLESPFRLENAGWMTTNFFAYSLVVAVLHAFSFQHSLRGQEVDAAVLRAQLSTMRLDMLRAQLHPHFLFNTLHTISELIHIDPGAADAMVVRLAQLLRASLDLSSQTEVPLSREIELITAYLDLHRMRHGDRIVVHMNIEARIANALVPPMIMQPLVENALRHGISRRSSTGTLWISATMRAGQLHLVVEDDGVGLPPVVREGVGLANVRTRLAELFADDHRVAILPRTEGGAIATLEMPLRFA
jgi:LytS/YehU family sensor histidine kinase